MANASTPGMKRIHDMPFGALPDGRGGARFRLWAPDLKSVDLLLGEGRAPADGTPMRSTPNGWFELDVARVGAGTDYAFRLDRETVVPDPAARATRHGVHGASALVDPLAFDWPDAEWRGRPWHEAVIYELHVGCFTPEGTFAAASAHLDELVALGVTAIELMPVAEFAGTRGWGYDGVLQFAPKAEYGSPDDFKALVAAAHARGLMVFLDVVYNHFGPDGNYLHAIAPQFFDPDIHTPWGPAINFGGEASRTVRDFFIHNALYWLEEFHLDGLRLDAVHAMHDASTPHVIEELARAVREGPGRQRAVHLVLENDVNDAAPLERDAQRQPRIGNAQWNDDVHHAVHVIATGETEGYYCDYADAPLRLLGRALAEGFAYQGEPSTHHGGKPRGTRSAHLPPLAFVNSLQTHDQIGNRALGERLATLTADGPPSPAEPAARRGGSSKAAEPHLLESDRADPLRALTACVLLAPSPPMLFMGEEWAASTPFLYFCDHHDELGRAVTEGRRAEFSAFGRFQDPAVRHTIPDPNALATFTRSQLDRSEMSRPPHAGWLALYRTLLELRRVHLTPWLAEAGSGVYSLPFDGSLRIEWPLGGGRRWHLLARLADHAGEGEPGLPGEVVYRSHPAGASLPPWSVQFSIEAA